MDAKTTAIRKVLLRRADVCQKVLDRKSADDAMRHYLQGKFDGYMQAYELLSDTLECIRVELDEED
jgi:hypothetical protein